MLLTLSTTHRPATDLGFLLHKNPARAQSSEVSSGTAHVFYPEATDERCTVALLLEVDPIGLVRSARSGNPDDAALAQYVNDRPYAASSLLAVALGKVFATARRGPSKERPDLVDAALPLEVHVPALSCRGGPDMARRFFEPLGWTGGATRSPPGSCRRGSTARWRPPDGPPAGPGTGTGRSRGPASGRCTPAPPTPWSARSPATPH